jgi:hypothetical protein
LYTYSGIVCYMRSPFLLNRLAAQKQLSAKACPCPVDKIEPSADIQFQSIAYNIS